MSRIYLLACLAVVSGCAWPSWLPQDSVPEEIVEEVIKEKTGLDIDLSPYTPEKYAYGKENLDKQNGEEDKEEGKGDPNDGKGKTHWWHYILLGPPLMAIKKLFG